MAKETNQLVGGRLTAIAGVAGALVVSGAFLFNHTAVHAASSAAAPLDDHSVSSLVALDNAVEAVAARVAPAVVNVAVTSKESPERATSGEEDGPVQALPPELRRFFGQGGMQGARPQGPQFERGVGSGIILSPDGYIVTNNHVIDGAVNMKVTLHDRRVMNARLIGTDKLTDIAVIKVDGKDLPSIPWGDSSTLKPGQTVLAFGSPFNFQNSVTRGIVSAVDRQNPYSDDARKPGAFIQTDAAINPGNSGGALVNAHGELVGINNFIISNSGSFQGAGFAIPAQIAKATADELIKHGVVHHGYLGIAMNDVTPENASFFHLETAEGAIVAQVTPDSPAARAGLKQGDVIHELNGQKIVNGSALQVAVSQDAPGTTIALGVLRDGRPQTVQVKVGEFHKDSEFASSGDPAAKKGKLGISVGDLTPDVRQQIGIPDQVRGVAVESVRPASPAEDAGLAPGDVILEVNRQPIASADRFLNAVRGNPAGKDLLLLVWSKGNASYRVVRPEQEG